MSCFKGFWDSIILNFEGKMRGFNFFFFFVGGGVGGKHHFTQAPLDSIF